MTKKEFDDIIVSYGLMIDPNPKYSDMVKMPGVGNWAFMYKNGSEIWSASSIIYDTRLDDKYSFVSWERNNIKGAKSLVSKIREFQETYKKMVKEHRLSRIREL